jgi:hypothetical protein
VAGILHAFMNARYQDPVREQFINEDPAIIGLNPNTALTGNSNTATVDAFLNGSGQTSSAYLDDPQALNFYSYGRDNPLRYTDPSGKYVDISGSITVPNIFDPALPGPSLALDLQVDKSGDYSLSAQPGIGWGAYAKPFSVYHVPGPVPSDSASPVVGADFFLLGDPKRSSMTCF